MWDLNDPRKIKINVSVFFSSFIKSGGANIFFEKPEVSLEPLGIY